MLLFLLFAFLFSEPAEIGKISIDGKAQISTATWIYVKTALDHYKETRPKFIMLKLDTPGGEVFAAQRISDALKAMDADGIPIVCVIDNWAISAGAMLAYSCRDIAIATDASMGAAEPLTKTAEGTVTASEKINSALRADFGNRAGYFNREPLLAEAMVDKDMELVWHNGKAVEGKPEEGGKLITKEGKLLTLNADEMMKYGVANYRMEPTKLEPITAKEETLGKWPASKELLFQQVPFSEYKGATVDAFQLDWKMQFLVWLASPVVASALVMGMMIGGYLEINSPGFGIPGSVALGCLFLIILSSNALEAAEFFELILIGVGLTLLAVDLFLIPSFGIIGTLGGLLAFGGMMALLLPGLESVDYDFDSGTLNAAGEYVLRRAAWLSGGFIVGLMGIVVIARYVAPTFTPFQKFVLTGSEQVGYVAGETNLPQVGERGTAEGMLRPTGKIRIRNETFHAITDGEFIQAGAFITVKRIDGNVVVVE